MPSSPPPSPFFASKWLGPRTKGSLVLHYKNYIRLSEREQAQKKEKEYLLDVEKASSICWGGGGRLWPLESHAARYTIIACANKVSYRAIVLAALLFFFFLDIFSLFLSIILLQLYLFAPLVSTITLTWSMDVATFLPKVGAILFFPGHHLGSRCFYRDALAVRFSFFFGVFRPDRFNGGRIKLLESGWIY